MTKKGSFGVVGSTNAMAPDVQYAVQQLVQYPFETRSGQEKLCARLPEGLFVALRQSEDANEHVL